MSNFDEKNHPRDSDGKFTDGNGQSKRDKTIAAVRKYSDDPKRDMEYSNLPSAKRIADRIPQSVMNNHDAPSPRGKNKSREEFFGEEFKGFKGSAAIDKLLQEKRGHIKNAFERQEIGGIDLVWGDETGGLLHTIQERDKLLKNGIGHISGLDMVKKIPEIVEKGIVKNDEKFRPCIEHDGYRVAIKPTFDGQKINWLISAMEIL